MRAPHKPLKGPRKARVTARPADRHDLLLKAVATYLRQHTACTWRRDAPFGAGKVDLLAAGPKLVVHCLTHLGPHKRRQQAQYLERFASHTGTALCLLDGGPGDQDALLRIVHLARARRTE